MRIWVIVGKYQIPESPNFIQKIIRMCNFLRLIFAAIFFVKSTVVFAALPFVTDDAAVGNQNQALIETYTEAWHLPKKK